MRRRHLFFLSVVSLLALSREAEPTSLYFGNATATVEFLGIDHPGGGLGVEIFPDAFQEPSGAEYEGDAFADYSTDAEILTDRVIIQATVSGFADDGSAWSGAIMNGGFWVINESPFEVTAFFRISAFLEAETDVFQSIGSAHAEARLGFDPDLVSQTTSGFDGESLEIPPYLESFTVEPFFANLFAVGVAVAGSANAVPAPVPEPASLILLALGLAAVPLIRIR